MSDRASLPLVAILVLLVCNHRRDRNHLPKFDLKIKMLTPGTCKSSFVNVYWTCMQVFLHKHCVESSFRHTCMPDVLQGLQTGHSLIVNVCVRCAARPSEWPQSCCQCVCASDVLQGLQDCDDLNSHTVSWKKHGNDLASDTCSFESSSIRKCTMRHSGALKRIDTRGVTHNSNTSVTHNSNTSESVPAERIN